MDVGKQGSIDLSKMKTKSCELLCLNCQDGLYKCPHCKGYFFYEKFQNNHGDNCLFLREKIEQKPCEYCQKLFDLDELGTHHMYCEEKKLNSVKCKFCNKDFHKALIKEHEKPCQIIQSELNLIKEKIQCEICKEYIPLMHFEVHEINCLKIQQQYKDLDAWAKGKMDYPDDWVFDHELFKSDLCMMPVDKYEHHVKYEFIEQMMINDMQNVRINLIWRLQNKELWQKYYYEKIKLSKEKGMQCKESWLFFGSIQHHPEKFFQIGFDIALSHEQGDVGKALYFYKNADFVWKNKGVYSKDGKNYIFLCKVLTGLHYIEKNSVKHRKTPFYDEKKLIYYDSITNHEVLDPTDLEYKEKLEFYTFYNHYFAVYDNHKAYPLYLIEFTERTEEQY